MQRTTRMLLCCLLVLLLRCAQCSADSPRLLANYLGPSPWPDDGFLQQPDQQLPDEPMYQFQFADGVSDYYLFKIVKRDVQVPDAWLVSCFIQLGPDGEWLEWPWWNYLDDWEHPLEMLGTYIDTSSGFPNQPCTMTGVVMYWDEEDEEQLYPLPDKVFRPRNLSVTVPEPPEPPGEPWPEVIVHDPPPGHDPHEPFPHDVRWNVDHLTPYDDNDWPYDPYQVPLWFAVKVYNLAGGEEARGELNGVLPPWPETWEWDGMIEGEEGPEVAPPGIYTYRVEGACFCFDGDYSSDKSYVYTPRIDGFYYYRIEADPEHPREGTMYSLLAYELRNYKDRDGGSCKVTVYGPGGEDGRLDALVQARLDGSDGRHVSPTIEVPVRLTEAGELEGTYYAVLSVIEDEATAKELNRDWQPKPALQHVSTNLQRIVDLDVDTDRDNLVEVDGDEPGEDEWTNQRGAILLVNCDDDDGDHVPDCHFPQVGNQIGPNEDEVINGEDDAADLGPLRIQRIRMSQFPGWQLRLEIPLAMDDHIRIFRRNYYDDQTPDNNIAVLGPNQGVVDAARGVRYWVVDQETLEWLEVSPVTLGAEATHFADKLDTELFRGLIRDIALVLDSDADPENNNDIARDVVHFRVAPFQLLSNQDPEYQTLVVRLDRIIPPPEGWPDLPNYDNQPFIDSLIALGVTVDEPIDGNAYEEDRWAQDELEIGYTKAPYQSIQAVLDLPRNGGGQQPGGLDPYPENHLLGPGFGYFEPWVRGDRTSGNFGGNIEATPPLAPPQPREGRQLVSGSMDTELTGWFFDLQEVQFPGIPIETEWLRVEHVDEIVNVLSGDDNPTVLVADSWVAWYYLQELQAAGQGNSPVTGHPSFNAWVESRPWYYPFDDIPELRPYVVWEERNGHTHWWVRTISEVLADGDLQTLNNNVVAETLDNLTTLLRNELPEAQIIRVPVLFFAPWGNEQECIAFTPNLVNAPVISGQFIVPRTFLPPRLDSGGRDYFLWRLEVGGGPRGNPPLPLPVCDVDDFWHYHLLEGEVHCATNVQRNIPGRNWWEGLP